MTCGDGAQLVPWACVPTLELRSGLPPDDSAKVFHPLRGARLTLRTGRAGRTGGGAGYRTRVRSRVPRDLYERSPGIDLTAPAPRDGLRLGQPRWVSRPAPRRHRAARPLVLASGPSPAVEGAVDVRPRPELFRYLRSKRKSRSAVIRTCMVPGFTSPGLGSPSRDPRPRRNHTPPARWGPRRPERARAITEVDSHILPGRRARHTCHHCQEALSPHPGGGTVSTLRSGPSAAARSPGDSNA